jgi:hypothetical protein
MSPYTPNDLFTSPEIYDLSDLVQGGVDGDANAPIKGLFDQTNFIKRRLSRWDDIKSITGDYAFDAADLRKLFLIQIAANKTFTLPDPGSLLPGTRLPILTAITGIKSLSVVSPKPILDGTKSWTSWQDDAQAAIYMHDGEKLILVAGPNAWYVETATGNFYSYGEDFAGRFQARNTLVAKGDLYQRADVPRLALLVKAGSPGVVDDLTWLSNPGGDPVYKGCYSTGNGATSLRVPDERGMSVRHLDLGRGVDTSRLYNNTGGYEKDQVGPHSHKQHGQTAVGNGGTIPALFRDTVGGDKETSTSTSVNTGSETIMKNIGKIPLIRY